MKTARQISAMLKAKKATPKKVDDDIDSDDFDYDLQFTLDRVAKQFFIDRDGGIIKYTGDLKDDIISIHYAIASSLYPDMKHPQSPDDYVTKKLGWVLVGSTVYSTPICYRKPTAAQMKTLQDLGDWYVDRLAFPYKDRMVKYKDYGALCAD